MSNRNWNWKSFGTGFLCSTLLFGLGASAMAAGAAGNVLFNQVNIGTDQGMIAAQNSGYRLENGQNVPYSITYMDGAGGGTVYLPIRKISEFTQTEISWDGSSNKVVLDVDTNAAYNTLTGKVGTYQEGYTAGYNDGVASRPTSSGSYDRGYDDGYDDGYSDGKKVHSNNGNYQTGYNDGYTDGYNAGKTAGGGTTSDRYQEGYDAGFAAGKVQGKTEGEKSGYDKGFAAGEESGYQKGYEAGYADGESGDPQEPGGGGTQEPDDSTKYYDGWKPVPDFSNVLTVSATPKEAKSPDGKSVVFTYVDGDEKKIELYTALLEEEGFSEVNTYSSDGGDLLEVKHDICQYKKGSVYVNVGKYSYAYTLVMITPYQVGEADFGFARNQDVVSAPPFDRDSVSAEELKTYLEDNVGTSVSTPTGDYTFEITVEKNSEKDIPYDFWIQVDWSSNLSWYDLANSMDISAAEREETLSLLSDYQERVYQTAQEKAPSAKMKGGYYSWYYKWPSIQEGFRTITAFSWMNYAPDNLVYDYDRSVLIGFKWATDNDTYKF